MRSKFVIALFIIVSASAFARNGQTKVNFGNMQIKGQTKSADTVYMSDRGQLNQKSQIKAREHYKEELKHSVFY